VSTIAVCATTTHDGTAARCDDPDLARLDQDVLVARQEVLADLLAALDGGEQHVVVAGPQGVGRTRVCLELATAARTQGHGVVLVRGALSREVPTADGSPDCRPVLIVDDADLVDVDVVPAPGALIVWAVRSGTEVPVPQARRLEITPLDLDGAGHLLGALLGSPLVTPSVVLAHDATGGRPLWLREWLEAARRQGLVHHIEGVWTAEGTPEPTARSRELVRWATSSLSRPAIDVLEALGRQEPVQIAAAPTGVVEELRAHAWAEVDGDRFAATVPWALAGLHSGTVAPSRHRTIGRRRRPPAPSPVATVMRALGDGEPQQARDAAKAHRARYTEDVDALCDAALCSGLAELWCGSAEADRWFVEASLLSPQQARAAETGARMARAMTATGTGPSALASNGVGWDLMPGDDPWLVNPVRAHAWELAADDDPAAVRVLEEGAIDAQAHGLSLSATMLMVDAALRDPTPARAITASSRLRDVAGAWASALRVLMDALASKEDAPIQVAAIGLAAEALTDIGDRRVAVEGFRLAANLARRHGMERDARLLHERAATLADGGPVGWNRDLPEAVLALPPRQRQIVLMAARGRSNREIADSLTISPRTVENQLHRAFIDLAVEDRRDLQQLVAH
jgi:DNA-binding NarL/FixJ family response regulator